MKAASVCCITGCERPPAADLDLRPLCRGHFISTCYELLDEYTRWLEENRFREGNTELVRRFLCESTRQATEMSHNVADLDNLERARLLDLLFRASELSRLLRRSARKVTSIPVRLTSEKLGCSWQEETQTRVISRHGASLGCNHAVEVGDQIELHRRDGTASVKARVVWRQARAGEQFEIGLEFLHCDNFWGEDWYSGEPAFLNDEPAKGLVR